jgi:ribonuclease HI
MKVTIYTDGACSGNPGPGGWAAVLKYGRREKELSGGEAETTNNRMELMAVISALSALNRPCDVELFTDSQYIERAINEHWLDAWKRRGWRRKDGELKNAELWQRLDELLRTHTVTFSWVRGHDGNDYNERCDALAVMEREKFANNV